jgi:uncharacterized DUF497 family protein
VQRPFFLIRKLYPYLTRNMVRGEDRWSTLGLDRTGELLVVCHTYREEAETLARIRIIPARKPTKNEAKHYGRD